MRVIGASAVCASAVVDELKEAAFHGRPAFVWSDGADLLGVFGEAGDSVADVQRMVPRMVPELGGVAS